GSARRRRGPRSPPLPRGRAAGGHDRPPPQDRRRRDGRWPDRHGRPGGGRMTTLEGTHGVTRSNGQALEPRPVVADTLLDDLEAGCALREGVLIGRAAVIAAGVTLTGTSRLYDLVRQRVLTGTGDAPLAVPPRAVVVPGARSLGGGFADEHGLSIAVAVLVKD